jgi:hypothetical protein
VRPFVCVVPGDANRTTQNPSSRSLLYWRVGELRERRDQLIYILFNGLVPARMAKLADARDLKSRVPKGT